MSLITSSDLNSNREAHHIFTACSGSNNAPKLNEDDDETIAAFVDRYISTDLPDEEQDPELHEIVKSVQMHRRKHSKSCKKGKKECRFNFPKCVAKETFICRPNENITDDDHAEKKAKATECLQALSKCLTDPNNEHESIGDVLTQAGFENYDEFKQALQLLGNRPQVVQKREPKDAWINQYNPDLLRAWNANMDIQFVLDPYACVMYIVSYI